MKTFLPVFLSLCFAVGMIAVAQDASNQAPNKHQAAGKQSTSSIMGVVSEQNEKLRFVTDRRAWNVDNPEILKGHEGHYVRLNAYIYNDKGSIHITEVKVPAASENRQYDER
jgi:hypothetical protein